MNLKTWSSLEIQPGTNCISFRTNVKEQLSQPGHIVLISPVLDATFKNPESRKYEKEDQCLELMAVNIL